MFGGKKCKKFGREYIKEWRLHRRMCRTFMIWEWFSFATRESLIHLFQNACRTRFTVASLGTSQTSVLPLSSLKSFFRKAISPGNTLRISLWVPLDSFDVTPTNIGCIRRPLIMSTAIWPVNDALRACGSAFLTITIYFFLVNTHISAFVAPRHLLSSVVTNRLRVIPWVIYLKPENRTRFFFLFKN